MYDFQKTQLEFIEHIKDPDNKPFKHPVESRRMDIYRDLFFNNIKGFLSSGFPVLESLYNEEQWNSLARQFFATHDCRSPYFTDISKEFVEYLSNEYELQAHDPIFMKELAHYEWMELAVSIRKQTQKWDASKTVSNVQMSQLASVVSYQFPVHQISQDYQPTEPSEAIYLVIHRDSDDKVDFTLITAMTAHLLLTIENNEQLSIDSLNTMMIESLPQLDAEQVIQGIKQIVEQMIAQEILVPYSISE
ncbi:putative DNA-binding domain-containing protein [Paraglaciecola sp. 20A4]|uniref:HvfC family RiPP maturation protein n=1 Tax=Paraglaciecola sp. 20A4 TaxID=2687288 RepID=UPI0014072BAD|nr:putative DNA-binding domain-containing protein [Paraglaciecola sp. 20A4]